MSNGMDVDGYMKAVEKNIDAYGWHCVAVFGDASECLSYTVGLSKTYGHPEVVVLGLPPELSHNLLIMAVDEIKAGGRLDGACDRIIKGGEVVFTPVSKAHVLEEMPIACMFLKDMDFEVVQLVWPDANGKFPWNPDVDAGTAKVQGRLGIIQGH